MEEENQPLLELQSLVELRLLLDLLRVLGSKRRHYWFEFFFFFLFVVIFSHSAFQKYDEFVVYQLSRVRIKYLVHFRRKDK